MQAMKRLSRRVVILGFSFLLVFGPAAVAEGSSRGSASGRLVFVRNQLCLVGPSGDKSLADCGRGEVAVAAADGSGLRVLTHDKVTEFSPRWSPDGRRIAFIRPKPEQGAAQVWLMNADGTRQHPLTRLSGTVQGIQFFGDDSQSRLDWSPNGRQIVFAAYPPDPENDGGPRHLYLASVRTGAVTPLTKGSTMASDDDDPVWSPNGRWIAFLRSPGRIMLLSTATHRVHQLSYRGGPIDALGLTWSPDSRQLAFNHLGAIYLVDIDGTHLRSLHVYGDQPSWSPDGRWILFCHSGARFEEIRPDGRGLHLVHRATVKNERSFEPDWGRR